MSSALYSAAKSRGCLGRVLLNALWLSNRRLLPACCGAHDDPPVPRARGLFASISHKRYPPSQSRGLGTPSDWRRCSGAKKFKIGWNDNEENHHGYRPFFSRRRLLLQLTPPLITNRRHRQVLVLASKGRPATRAARLRSRIRLKSEPRIFAQIAPWRRGPSCA